MYLETPLLSRIFGCFSVRGSDCSPCLVWVPRLWPEPTTSPFSSVLRPRGSWKGAPTKVRDPTYRSLGGQGTGEEFGNDWVGRADHDRVRDPHSPSPEVAPEREVTPPSLGAPVNRIGTSTTSAPCASVPLRGTAGVPGSCSFLASTLRSGQPATSGTKQMTEDKYRILT